MSWFSKATKAVSKPFEQAGGAIGGLVGQKDLGEKIGGFLSPGALAPGGEAFGKAAGSITSGLTGSEALGNMVGGAAGGQGLQMLPAGGMMQQANTINDQIASTAPPMPGAQMGTAGGGSLDQMARTMAQSYGLPVGKGRIVDEHGNFMFTPDQLAGASGGKLSVGDASAKMNLVSQALTREQNTQQQKKGVAAIQTGLGQVQSRGRGSLAGMMSGFYQDLAGLYSNQEYESADFSYWIEKEKLDKAEQLQKQQQKQQKKQAQFQTIAGIVGGGIGVATQNWGMAAQGFGSAASSAGNTGWF